MKPKFEWKDVVVGQRIEDFLLSLCLYLPGVAREILKVGFGDLTQWYGGRRPASAVLTWKNAKCGCLVGQASLSVMKQMHDVKDIVTVEDEDSFTNEAPYILYIAIASAMCRNISRYKTPETYRELESYSRVDPLLRNIVEVGVSVGNEASGGNVGYVYGGVSGTYYHQSEREVQVGDYLLDYIRVILTDMGFTRLPKSPENSTVSNY